MNSVVDTWRIDPLKNTDGTDAFRLSNTGEDADVMCQLQADLLQTDTVCPVVDGTTALGAADAAGLAVGYLAGLDELRSNWRIDREVDPRVKSRDAENRYARWADAV